MDKILVNGVTEILKPLITLISEQITRAWGVKDDLRKLKETLESIQALITSAEENQANDPTARLWLRRLKDVVYDVDDVMDEFSYETIRPRKHKVRAFVSSSNPLLFQFKMARKIRAINKRLDEAYKNSDRYQLQNTSTFQDNQTREQRNRLTSSVVDDSILLGREGAKSDIMKILMDKSSPSKSYSSSGISSQPENISTLSIVGMGGLGKTMVAQMVYKDESVVRNFEPRVWVCVSDTFDIYKILRDIIECITRSKCDDPSNVDVLANRVNEKLIGKKYLLILDDLWNEDVRDWEKMKSFLVCGALGSKILVTTRNQKVASAVGGAIYSLEKLSDGVCWSIIERKVLSQGGTVLTPEMISIGRDIAERCDGLPLAADSLGSLMCSRRNESYWLSIVNKNDLWSTPEDKKVISILKLSYDNLSSPLKQCFSYCCIFPKDWIIRKETLIRLWMAEGFLLPSSEEDDISLEDIGNEYFDYLVWSSFFQNVQQVVDDPFWGDSTTCKMHDLVHDLATSVLDCNEFGIAMVRDDKEQVSEVRRLQLLFDEGPSLESPKVLSNAVKLRTIVALDPRNFWHINSFLRCRHLRVLCPLNDWYACSLSCGLHDLSTSPLSYSRMFCLVLHELCSASSICKLKHLRYLDLSCTTLFREVSLYHSYNLQTLILRGCKNVPNQLLRKIGSFKSLRHVDVSFSDIKRLPENIGFLKHLSYLNLSGTAISKLPESITCISSLRTLNFKDCRNLDALPRQLGALTRLRCLDVMGTKIEILPESCIIGLCNLEKAIIGPECELPKEIKNWPKLKILAHCGKDDVMPCGIDRLIFLETLVHYTVRKEAAVCGCSRSNCSSGSGIEELAHLNSLQVLHIRKLENVSGGKEGAERAKLKDKQRLRELFLSWGFSFTGGDDDDEEMQNSRIVNDGAVLEGLQPHLSLEDFQIVGFSGLKFPKWMMGSSLSSCLPNLVVLGFFNCNSCEKLPPLGMLPFLRCLKIGGMKSIKCLGEEFYYQEEEGSSCSGTSNTCINKSCSLFPSLAELLIRLENLEEWVAPPLSSSSPYFPSLIKLAISYHRKLRTSPITSFSSLKELKLSDTDDNAANTFFNRREGCLASLTSIEITSSPELIYLPPLRVLLQNNTHPNLQKLGILYCDNLQDFRDDDDLNTDNDINTSVQSLKLEWCPVLTSLLCFRLCTCIRSLHLGNCHLLTSLPDLRLWTCLRELRINRCDKLNKESVPYDLQKSLTFLKELRVDFIQRDEQLGDDRFLINLMDKKKK